MTRIILWFILLSLYFGTSEAQDTGSVFNVRPTGSYNPSGTVVSAVKLNVLYIGIDNPIDISVPGVPARDISASISEGSIIKTGDGHFVALVSSRGKCLVFVYVKDKEVSRHEFRVRRVPDPVVTLDGELQGGNIRLATFKAVKGLVVKNIDFELEPEYSVVSFRFTLKRGDQVQVTEIAGPLFNKEVSAVVNQAKPRDVIIIDNAVVTGPDSQSRKLKEVTFTLM